MKWKFWEKDTEKEEELLTKITDLEEQIENLHNTIVEMGTHNKQMNRLQYNHNQEMKKRLNGIEAKIEKNQINEKRFEQLKNKIKVYQSMQSNNIDFLISFIDEIDLISQKLSEDEGKWHQLLNKWQQGLLNSLEKQGVYQIKILNTEFNPRLAEAISVLGEEEIENSNKNLEYNNHDIVEVFKRAYKNSAGEIIRKATVSIFKGEN